MPKTLTSDRFTLRPLAKVDTSWLARFWSLPEVNRNTATIPANVNEDFADNRVVNAMEGEEAQTNIVRLIECENERAGVVSLGRSSPRDAYSLGYSLHPEFWGKGIATEACQMLLNWTDQFVYPKYYVSGHFTDNPASGTVLRKLGFLPCWRGPVHSIARDETVDHLYMSRLI